MKLNPKGLLSIAEVSIRVMPGPLPVKVEDRERYGFDYRYGYEYPPILDFLRSIKEKIRRRLEA